MVIITGGVGVGGVFQAFSGYVKVLEGVRVFWKVFRGVPGFLEGVPGFLEGVPGCPGFFTLFRVFQGVPGCSGVPCSGVPVYRCSGVPVFRCSWNYYMPVGAPYLT